jgi:hypothetical protein
VTSASKVKVNSVVVVTPAAPLAIKGSKVLGVDVVYVIASGSFSKPPLVGVSNIAAVTFGVNLKVCDSGPPFANVRTTGTPGVPSILGVIVISPTKAEVSVTVKSVV